MWDNDACKNINSVLIVNEQERNIIRQTGTIVHYPKDQIIFSANEQADRVYLIEEGYVKIYRLNPEGRELTVGIIRNPGEIMGLAEVLYHGKRTCFAGAINDVTMVTMTKDQFIEILDKEHHLAIKVAVLLGARMRAAESIVYNLMCIQAPGRLALMLLKISEECGVKTNEGVKIKLQLTHNDIASMIGSTRQTVTSIMNMFRNKECILVQDREIVIKDSKKLAEWVT